MNTPTIGKSYTLAGDFPSRWQCMDKFTVVETKKFCAVMRNIATEEYHLCYWPEVNEADEISWSCSEECTWPFPEK